MDATAHSYAQARLSEGQSSGSRILCHFTVSCLTRPTAVDAQTVNRHIIYMNYRDIITIEPGKRNGKPCIRGLRITVYDVLEYLASGMSEAEILEDFPDLTREDIRACLAFAADRERRLSIVPAE